MPDELHLIVDSWPTLPKGFDAGIVAIGKHASN